MTKDYSADFKEAIRDLLHMASEREQLDTRIAKQKKRVAALYELAQIDEEGRPLPGLVEGVTDACRVVLRAAERPLVQAEIRDRVQALGLPPQANLLASVHTTLKRMKDGQEIEEVTIPLQTGGMGTAYQWNFKMMTTLSSLAGGQVLKDFCEAAAEMVASGSGFPNLVALASLNPNTEQFPKKKK